MSRVVNKTETLTFIPTGYSDITFTSSYYQNLDNGLAGSNSTTYAVFAMRNTNYHIYYDFSVSGIPSNATITSVSCSVKGYVSDSSYYPSVRLYSGTTAKGSASNITSTSSSNVTTLNVGTWTISELENARLYIAVASRSGSASTSNRYFRFYGATVTINYTYPTTEYEITTTVQSGSVTFSPTSQYVESGNDAVVTINNLTDITTFSLTDNEDNIVSELVHLSGNTYTYTIENISTDHELIAKTVPAYNVTVTNNSTNLTYLNPASGTISKAGQGSDFEVKFIPTDIDYINIYDNGLVDKSVLTTERPIVEDFTSFIPTSYSGNTFTGNNLNLDRGLTGTSSTTYATLTANNTNTDYVVYYQFDVSTIPQNAVINSVSCNIRIRVSNSFSSTNTGVELYSGNTSKSNRNNTWYNSTTATTYPLANIQSFTREELDDIQIKITGRSSYSDRSIYFYGADLTVEYEYEGNIYYIYSAQNIQSARTIRFEDKVKYNITGTSNLSGASISPSSGQAYDGTDYTVNLLGLPSSNAYKLYDNDVDVTSSVVVSNPYEITSQVSGASYGFVLNGSGYYESSNQGVDDSASVCRVNFNFESAAEVTIQYINYGEARYDYGIFSNIDSALNTTSTADSNTFKSCNTSADNTLTPQTLIYQIPAGNHFIDIKFRKDTGTNTSPDSLQWKILNISGGSNNYTYTITNVSAAHTLRLEENTYYSVSGTSSFDGKTISGTSSKVYKGDSITLTLTGITNANSFILKDNDVDVTESTIQSGTNYTYTISNVQANHTLTLSEQIKYTITATSEVSGITVSVSNNPAYVGESTTITVNNVSNIDLISIFDNGVTAITSRFSQSGTTLTYTFENINANHSITVVEHVYYNLSITNDTTNSTVIPTGTVSNIDAGESYTITLETSDISIIQVIDNDINKTEDLVHIPAQNDSIVLYINSSSNASSSGYTNFTTSTSFPIANASDASSDTRNYFRLRSTTSNGQHEVWLNFDNSDLSDIPSNANLSVTCKISFYVNSATYISALSVQLYSGNTAKGTATTSIPTSRTIYTLNIGDWTLAELQNARIRFTATHNNSTSQANIYIYGADLTINYSIPEYYEYTLTDISANHTIVFLEGAAFTLYSKNNNAWVQVSKVYKKINGIWVEQMNGNDLFDTNKIYMRK